MNEQTAALEVEVEELRTELDRVSELETRYEELEA